MSTLLEIVSEAREIRREAQAEFVRAVVRARERHSLAEVGRAAGMTRQAVRWIIQRDNGAIDGYGRTLEREDEK